MAPRADWTLSRRTAVLGAIDVTALDFPWLRLVGAHPSPAPGSMRALSSRSGERGRHATVPLDAPPITVDLWLGLLAGCEELRSGF
jgi:hypothetical protein